MTRTSIRKIKPFAESDNAQTADARTEGAHLFAVGQPVTLADKKYELTLLKEQLEEELSRIDEELKQKMHAGDVVTTHHGVGYRLCTATHDVYDERAVRELSRMRMLPQFARVSTTKLRELVKAGKLSENKFNALRELASPREIVTLREIPLAETHAG